MKNGNKRITISITVIAVLIIALASTIILIIKINKSKDNPILNTNKNAEENITEFDNNNVSGSNNSLDDIAKTTFNSMFDPYKDTNLSSTQVKSLLSLIASNNSTRTDGLIIDLTPEWITSEEQIEDEKIYTAEFFYDSNGYINEIKITEYNGTQENNNETDITNDLDKLIFNTKFTPYLGEITAQQLAELVQTIQTTLNTDQRHNINLTSNNLKNLDGITTADVFIVTLTCKASPIEESVNQKYVFEANKNQDVPVVTLQLQLEHAVREEIYRYLTTTIDN